MKVKGIDVVSYSQHFQELVLMCGRMFPEEFNEVKKYVEGLPDMIQGSVMAFKPKIIQESIEFATEMMDQKIQCFQGLHYRADDKKEYGGSLPLCPKCNYHHKGQCAPMCNNCKKVSHLDCDCRSLAANANNQINSKANQMVVTCFENQAGNGGAQARAYAVGNARKNSDSNVGT
nr:hypothetical protein [Tanacetum cinerariifolium]